MQLRKKSPIIFRGQLLNAALKHRHTTKPVNSGHLKLPKPNTESLKQKLN